MNSSVACEIQIKCVSFSEKLQSYIYEVLEQFSSAEFINEANEKLLIGIIIFWTSNILSNSLLVINIAVDNSRSFVNLETSVNNDFVC